MTHFTSKILFIVLFLVPLASQAFEHQKGFPKADFNSRYIEVPVSADRPELGRFMLHYRISCNFNPKLPTILLINDAQALPMAAVADSAKSKYPGANFIGVELRGCPFSPVSLPGLIGENIDWQLAYEVFKAENVLNDYEAVRKDFFGDKQISIMGGSGGGILAYQYLGKFGHRVKEALIYTASAELNSVGAHDKENLLRVMGDFGVSESLAEEVFSGEVEKRKLLYIIDQEIKNHSPQNTALPQLFMELRVGNHSLYNQLLAKYGDADERIQTISKLPSVAVRFFEIFPYCEDISSRGFPSHPNAMVYGPVIKPLMVLVDQKVLPLPQIDVIKQIQHFSGRFMGITAEWDNIIPMQSSLASCRSIPGNQCVLIKDTHLFVSSRPAFETFIKEFFKIK